MGIFDVFKKQPTPAPQPASTPQPAPSAGVSLTKNPELDKKISLRKNIVVDLTKKQNIGITAARVVFVLDHSGSMRQMYKDGTVQDVLERIFPIAMHFDDNAEMEFYLFDSNFRELIPVNYSSIDGYVQRVILSRNDHFGGTMYAPVIKEITDRYTKREPAAISTFVIFITDGSNSDKKDAKEAITTAANYNIFWKFVGIGNEKFEFLERLDELEGRFVDNANFVSINDITKIDDRELYSRLLEEYGDWSAAARQKGLKV